MCVRVPALFFQLGTLKCIRHADGTVECVDTSLSSAHKLTRHFSQLQSVTSTTPQPPSLHSTDKAAKNVKLNPTNLTNKCHSANSHQHVHLHTRRHPTTLTQQNRTTATSRAQHYHSLTLTNTLPHNNQATHHAALSLRDLVLTAAALSPASDRTCHTRSHWYASLMTASSKAMCTMLLARILLPGISIQLT